jgi:hypothetical protein
VAYWGINDLICKFVEVVRFLLKVPVYFVAIKLDTIYRPKLGYYL